MSNGPAHRGPEQPTAATPRLREPISVRLDHHRYGLMALIAAGSGVGKMKQHPVIVENLTKVNLPIGWLPKQAVLELLGAAGAVIAHLRANDHEIVRPGAILLIAVAAIVLRAITI